MDNHSGGYSGRGKANSKNYLYESGKNTRQVGGHGRAPKKKKLPVWFVITTDVLLTALLLLVFYITNYEMHGQIKPVALPTPSPSAAVLAHSATNSAGPSGSDAAGTSAPTVDPNDWRAKFADKFTDGAPETTENSYKSANINVKIDKVVKDDVPYFIADIYVASLENFKTAFAKDADVLGATELTSTVAKENNAILAINGDHCLDNKGLIIRNGNYYPAESRDFDVLVMYRDGTMKTLSPEEVNVESIKAESPYQVWSFGPMLLKDGQPMTEFNSDFTRMNPRTAIGYYEPGHYCFVQVGGRLGDYSLGCTMTELSQLFADLKCNVAYNLDGGQSSEIIFMGNMLNTQTSRRSTPDILYIGEKGDSE